MGLTESLHHNFSRVPKAAIVTALALSMSAGCSRFFTEREAPPAAEQAAERLPLPLAQDVVPQLSTRQTGRALLPIHRLLGSPVELEPRLLERRTPGPVEIAPDFKPHLTNTYRIRGRDKRTSTELIVVHWTDDDFVPLYVKRNRLANYLINRDGTIHRVVPHQYEANHTGEKRWVRGARGSLWDGNTELDKIALGIEVVSRGENDFTERQWKSLRWLTQELQDIYSLEDDAIVGHYEVAFPRGRKVDPACLPWREKLGIEVKRDSIGRRYDPDILAGRAEPSPEIAVMERYGICSERVVSSLLAAYPDLGANSVYVSAAAPQPGSSLLSAGYQQRDR